MDVLNQIHTLIFDANRIPTILAAWFVCLVIGMVSGPLRRNIFPFGWQVFEILLGRFGDKLDKVSRPRADLMFRGFIVCAVALLIASGLGKAYEAFIPVQAYFGALPVLLLALLMSAGTSFYALLQLYFAMEQKKPSPAAFQTIQQSARSKLSDSDEYGVTRRAIGLAAVSFDKALVAPSLWYLIGGFPLAVLYTALAALKWRFGKSGCHSGFAGVPVALEKLMGFVPGLFAALLLNMAALITPTAKLGKSLTAWMGYKGRATYEQGGFALSALAYALNITLGGASQDLSGSAVKAEWVGPQGATAKVTHHHLRRALYIYAIAQLLFIASLLGAYIWSGILS